MRYNVKYDSKKIKESRKYLKWIYDQMPGTKGCLENIAKDPKDGGCEAWCCSSQFPSAWYVEFLYSWNYVIKNWNNDKIISLIERSLRNYLFASKTRGCVFWDKTTKQCSQHESRGYNCRVYGVEPEEEFNDRLVRLKVIYPNLKSQCNLVSTEDGKIVTKEDTKKWWNRLQSIENSIGVTAKYMHDGPDGSYRAYHDHILLHLFDDELMSKLTEIRTTGNPIQKESCIRNILETLKDYVTKKIEDQNKEMSS